MQSVVCLRLYWRKRPKEVSHEYQRQNILATTWKIEENKSRFDEASEDLKLFQSLSDDSLSEMRTEHMALICTYHEDISRLTLTDEELDPPPHGSTSRC